MIAKANSILFTLFSIGIALAPARTVFAAELAPKEIVREADRRRMPPGQLSFIAVTQDFDESEQTHETRYKILANGNFESPASLVTTIYPERSQGRKLLLDKDNLWMYTPNTKRPARVGMQQRLSGELANGDLVSTNFYGDYNAELVGKVDVDGTEAYHLKLKASHTGVTYSRIDYWVAVKDYIPIKAIFYAVSGKALKRGVFMEPKTVLGHLCITKVQFTDALEPKKHSVLTYKEHKKVTLAPNYFSKERLGE